jgi:hypothetical protein
MEIKVLRHIRQKVNWLGINKTWIICKNDDNISAGGARAVWGVQTAHSKKKSSKKLMGPSKRGGPVRVMGRKAGRTG